MRHHSMQSIRSQKGFSLIELALGIVVVSIALVGAMVSLANIEAKSVNVELLSRATNYANNILETVVHNRFDENMELPWSIALGPEEGNFAEFDDVDDFHNLNWTDPGLPGYSGVTIVQFVSEQDWVSSSQIPTSLKTITVTVTHQELDVPVVLKTTVSAGQLLFGLIGDDDDDDDDDNEETMVICHKPGTPAEQTMTIPVSAWAGHLGHGDTIGPCDDGGGNNQGGDDDDDDGGGNNQGGDDDDDDGGGNNQGGDDDDDDDDDGGNNQGGDDDDDDDGGNNQGGDDDDDDDGGGNNQGGDDDDDDDGGNNQGGDDDDDDDDDGGNNQGGDDDDDDDEYCYGLKAWKSNKNYKRNDQVKHDSRMWKARRNNKNSEPSDGVNWQDMGPCS